MLSAQRQSRVLLDFVEHTVARQGPGDIELLSQTLPIARKNDIHFYVLSLLSGANSEKFNKAINAEYIQLAARERYVEEETGRLSRFFAERDLPVFFIKDFMRYPFTDHDVDFVAAKRSLSSVYRTCMTEAGYQYRFGKSQIREPDKYFYYPLHAENGFADIRFHLHKALSWNGVVFLDSESVLARCRQEERAGGAFLVPSCEDEILIMAAHALYENASIRAGELLQFGLLVRDEKIDWQYLVEAATHHNWQAGLAFFLEAVRLLSPGVWSVQSPPYIGEWTADALSETGITDVLPSGEAVFPCEIPHISCMRLYIDKVRRDIRRGTLPCKAVLWESLALGGFVGLTRLKKRLTAQW